MRCLHTQDLYDVSNETWLTTVSSSDADCYNLSLNDDAGVTIVSTLPPYNYDAAVIIVSTLPPYLTFNENSLAGVIVYCLLFLMAAVGNLTVFVTLTRSRHRKSRINVMLMHLALADLMVTFIMIPLEVGWRLTVQWVAGNLACKVFLFLRAFGLYLSSNVLVCISLDRYFAVLYPLRVNDARRRGKVMLGVAWCISLVWSLPQSLVFSVRTHPKYPTFRQCVTYGFFTSSGQEVAYNLACLLAMYFVPLFVICFAYTAIMCEISKKSREGEKSNTIASNGNSSGHMRLRRSDISNIERARSRTLRLTATIVAVFVFCWTPYVVMTLWYMFDRESAMKVDARLQDALFIMAVSNSCMNPLVYGSYAMSFRRECYRLLTCSWCPTRGDNGIDVGGQIIHRTLDKKSLNGVALGAVDQRTSGGTGVALKTKDLSETDGGSRLACRVIKNVLSFRKVGSGVTRSTGTLHPVTARNSPQLGSCGGLLSQSRFQNNDTIRRLPSAGQISLMSEPINGAATSYRLSFHSEPVNDCNATTFQQQQINSDSLRCSRNTVDPLTRFSIETNC